jgi:hypothetical protein
MAYHSSDVIEHGCWHIADACDAALRSARHFDAKDKTALRMPHMQPAEQSWPVLAVAISRKIFCESSSVLHGGRMMSSSNMHSNVPAASSGCTC